MGITPASAEQTESANRNTWRGLEARRHTMVAKTRTNSMQVTFLNRCTAGQLRSAWRATRQNRDRQGVACGGDSSGVPAPHAYGPPPPPTPVQERLPTRCRLTTGGATPDNTRVSIAELPSRASSSSDRPAAAPNWDRVPFDVACARCGHDLRGLTDPVCPACNLSFDWDVAVPIEHLTCATCGYHLCGLTENRCPECGEAFTWESALAEHYRRLKPLFEYNWRQSPVRSVLRSFDLATRPRRLWRTIDMHDPPRPGPLLFLAMTSMVVMLVAGAGLEGLLAWSFGRTYGIGWIPTHAQLPAYVMEAIATPASYTLGVVTMSWAVACLMALMVYRQSMRACRVRIVHVLRVWVYSLALLLPLTPLFRYVLGFIGVKIGPWRQTPFEPVAIVVFVGFVSWSIQCGYRNYLRMPHGPAVAIATQVIALLTTVTIFWGVPYWLGRLGLM